MISLITQIDNKGGHPLYYFVRAINLDIKNLKNSAWKLYALIKLFKRNLHLHLLIGEEEQLYLRLPDNKKETLLRVLTNPVFDSFTSEQMIADWKEVTTATITIKFL